MRKTERSVLLNDHISSQKGAEQNVLFNSFISMLVKNE